MILLWLVPPVVVTVTAMIWVTWLGREGRGSVDREVALRRMARALEPGSRRQRRTRTNPGYAVVPTARDRSTGVAVRPAQVAAQLVGEPVVQPVETRVDPSAEPAVVRHAS